jgi:hypothetical protein
MPVVNSFNRCFKAERNQQTNSDSRNVNQEILQRMDRLVGSVDMKRTAAFRL